MLAGVGEVVEAAGGAFLKVGVAKLEGPGVAFSVGAGVVESVGTRAGSFLSIT